MPEENHPSETETSADKVVKEISDRTCHRMLYGLAVRYGGVRDADDLVQSTLLKAFRFRDQYDPARGATVRTWLGEILRSEAAERRRQEKKKPYESLEDHPLVLKHISSSQPSVEEYLMVGSNLDEAIRCLAEQGWNSFRIERTIEALLFTSIAGMTHEEAAIRLGVAPHMVSNNVSKARQILGWERHRFGYDAKPNATGMYH